MNKPLALAVAAALPATLLGGCHHSWNSTSHHYAHLIPLDPPPGAQAVTLSTAFGDLDVAPTGETAPTWAAKHFAGAVPEQSYLLAITQSHDEERPALVTFETGWTDEGFTVVDVWPGGRQGKLGEGVGYVLRIPQIAGVDLTTDFGDIDAIDVNGTVYAESEFGDVTVFAINAPEATLKTDHGDLEIHGVTGPITLETDFGDIDGLGLAGPVNASTDHGDIDLRLTPSNPGPFTAITSFGDVRVTVGRALAGSLEMETDFGDTRFTGFTGSGSKIKVGGDDRSSVTLSEGPASRAETSHGDVRVVVSEEG